MRDKEVAMETVTCEAEALFYHVAPTLMARILEVLPQHLRLQVERWAPLAWSQCPFEGDVEVSVSRSYRSWYCPACGALHEDHLEPDWDWLYDLRRDDLDG